MSTSDSFIGLMSHGCESEDDDAASEISRRFVRRLVALACRQFGARDQVGADPEGVVQSAMGSFFARVGRGQFEFDGWEQLWGLLA